MHVPPPDANEPCLCGSGRPFGTCCADAYAVTTAAWRRARETTRRLINPIVDYAVARWGVTFLTTAIDGFLSCRQERDMRYRWNLFYRWFAYTRIANWDDPQSDTPTDWPAAPVGVVWLESHPDEVSEYDFIFVMTASESPCSLLLVEDVTPRWHLTVTDLMTGLRFRVIDPEVSTLVRADELLVSAVLTLDGVSTLLGPSNCALPRAFQQRASDSCRSYDGRRWLTRAELLGRDYVLHDIYHTAFREGADRYAQTLECDEDPLDPCLLRWSVRLPFDEILERLRPLTMCFDDEEAIDLERRPNGEPEAELTWYRPGASGDPDDDWEPLARLYLTEGRLAAEVPTAAPADALLAEIGARLGSAATLLELRQDSARPHTPSRTCLGAGFPESTSGNASRTSRRKSGRLRRRVGCSWSIVTDLNVFKWPSRPTYGRRIHEELRRIPC